MLLRISMLTWPQALGQEWKLSSKKLIATLPIITQIPKKKLQLLETVKS